MFGEVVIKRALAVIESENMPVQRCTVLLIPLHRHCKSIVHLNLIVSATISLVHADNTWTGYAISAQLIAEATENRFVELDWKYGR